MLIKKKIDTISIQFEGLYFIQGWAPARQP